LLPTQKGSTGSDKHNKEKKEKNDSLQVSLDPLHTTFANKENESLNTD
jgi:hypothetical protein